MEEQVDVRERVKRGRRTISWRFFDVEQRIAGRIILYLRENESESLNYSYQLRNIETDATMIYNTHKYGPVHSCLQQEEVNRPNTHWSFVRFLMMDVKVS